MASHSRNRGLGLSRRGYDAAEHAAIGGGLFTAQ